jgi:hypothetical protein
MRFHFVLIIIFLVFLILSILSTAVEFTVGVSPPLVDLGEVEKGSTKIVKFYLVTPSTEPLLVHLIPETGNLDFFNRGGYRDILFNYSEEDVLPWFEFLNNPIELKLANETLKTKAGEIRGWREVSFLINIPNNSESGYHMAKIKPIPTVPSELIGEAGARVVAITSVTILFDVPGEARREGIILDVTPGNYGGNRLEINTYFQNVGTVTISAMATNKVYFKGNSVANITSSTEFVKPKEVKILKSFLTMDELTAGDYNVSTTVSYTTGDASKNSTMAILPKEVITGIKPEVFPWWIIILIIILIIAVCIYKWYK